MARGAGACMTESTWTAEELELVDAAEEIEIAPRHADGTLHRPVPIWVVRVVRDLYVRSWRGTSGSWFRAARATGAGRIDAGSLESDVAFVPADDAINDAVDAAYRDKYGRYPSYVEPMVAPQARATTLRLVPHQADRA
jgi:hypothetical protein